MPQDYDAAAVADVLGLTFEDMDPTTVNGTGPTPSGRSALSEAGAVQVLSGQVVWTAPSSMLIERAVASGLLRASLRVVAERIAGDDGAIISSVEHSVGSATEDRWAKLSVPQSERTERLARLFVHARHALGTEPEAREFLMKAHPELEGRSPVDAARTDLGARRVERILTALEYGLAL